MAQIRRVTGVETVLKNLKTRRDALAAGLVRGLTLAGLRLQRESQRVVPVDYGILKASAFTRAEGKGLNTEVLVGYTANYALFVHEKVEMKLRGQPRMAPHKGRYWDPQGRGQAKFLEEPARRLSDELLQTIRNHMKIK